MFGYLVFKEREEVFLNGVRKLTPSLVPTERGQMHPLFSKKNKFFVKIKKATRSSKGKGGSKEKLRFVLTHETELPEKYFY